MLTDNQQSIVDSLVSEFTRINNSKTKRRKFKLVDIDPLCAINDEIEVNKAVANADAEHWKMLRKAEAERIADLLKHDLPNAVIEVIDFKIRITRNGYSELKPREVVCIYIKTRTETVGQSHGCYYSRGVRLQYEGWDYTSQGEYYNSIEELIEKSDFKNHLRKHVL